MFEQLIQRSIAHRGVVMLFVAAMAAIGMYNLQRLPIDAVPDITNVQVQINTEAAGYTPLESESRVTFPIETAMAGLPGLQKTRSISRYGLSQVTVIFNDDMDIYFARQLVNERLQQARSQLPAGLTPEMGPISSGLGEIFTWTVQASPLARRADGHVYQLRDLRTLQDWVIKPQLLTVAGVTEVNAIGGSEKHYLVAPNPHALLAYGVSFAQLVNALKVNNKNQGAGYIERRGEQYLVRVPGRVADLDEIAQIAVTTVNHTPVLVRDLANVMMADGLRTGAATQNGQEVVLGTVMMLMGANSQEVAQAVAKRLVLINQSLPDGVSAVAVYDRTTLIEKTIHTVQRNLAEGALLVIVILFVFLGNFRAALITAAIIPLSMLFTFSGMVNREISANLMSLGALDFGIIVDGAVVIVESSLAQLSIRQKTLGRPLNRKERFETVFHAAKAVRHALLFGQLIIIVVYLPIFSLSGVEGKMFHPMAFTVVMALLAAMLLSVTFVPAAIALFVTTKVGGHERGWLQPLKNRYRLLLKWTLLHGCYVFASAVVLLLLCGLLATRMGAEFIPRLDEGDIAMHALRIPGTSLSQAVMMQTQLETAIKKLPEVERIFAKTGTADVATDPMPPSISDNFIMLKPRDQWPDASKTKAQLVDELQVIVAEVPGNNYEFTQPIQMRFNELLSGVRADVAVKVFGDDLTVMLSAGEAIADSLRTVDGSADVQVEQVSGLPTLNIDVDRSRLARFGLNMADVQQLVKIAVGGEVAGDVFEGDRRFDLVVRLDDTVRSDVERLRALPIILTQSSWQDGKGTEPAFTTLGDIADINLVLAPNQIGRENGKRRVVVTSNVRNRDIGSFITEAKDVIDKKVTLPHGYWLSWGGQFEQLISAGERLKIVLPVTLVLIFILLFYTFGNLRDGLLVFSGVPFALTGGILALWFRDMPLSISASIGFITLSGVAVLNGLVMVSFINKLLAEGCGLQQAVIDGAVSRLRPVLMTALVAALGFIPMAIATGTGAEVQRPLATVVIGGVVSSTLLTLWLLPGLYFKVKK